MNSDHSTRASGACLDISALPAQLGAADMADFEAGTWTFSMHGDWKVAAGDFAIVPADSFIALHASHQRLKDALRNLLNDTQHAEHTSCKDGPCPVREARDALESAP